MRFVHLVHLDVANFDRMSVAERQDVDRRALANNAELEQRGALIHAEAIQDDDSAVLVRVRNGQISVTDGPYIETKEQMAGFALIEAPDIGAAVAIAGEDPIAEYGTIEVRPVYVIPAS
ncbi:MAG: hypothetical protein JNL14_10335 [Devosia sp.]|uniref:YciI family protein n=1 Tax=Devosia sp. TaxID=1871048 RepID=UPI001A3D62DA|nr:YciI family protein [Devosia sp.]MBL8598123.1 hypothetical protein [Devosia sp.]